MRSGYLKTAPERIRVIHMDDVESGMYGGSLDGRHDGRMIAQLHALFHASDEPATDVALVDEGVARRQPAAGRELRHPRRSAGAAGTAVDGALAIKHRVP